MESRLGLVAAATVGLQACLLLKPRPYTVADCDVEGDQCYGSAAEAYYKDLAECPLEDTGSSEDTGSDTGLPEETEGSLSCKEKLKNLLLENNDLCLKAVEDCKADFKD